MNRNSLSPMGGSEMGTPTPPHRYSGMVMAPDLSSRLTSARTHSPALDTLLTEHQTVAARKEAKLARLEQLSPLHDFHQLPGRKENVYKSLLVHVEESEGETPHFNPDTRLVSSKRSMGLNALAHEMRHAVDHLQGQVDATIPQERLAGEMRAFSTQIAVSGDLQEGNNLEGRNATQMAESYHGKEKYPGTLSESIRAVQQRHTTAGTHSPTF
ncbi:hypothetical protein PMI16_00427 [Herbaspirillum sp. CF444]|uniref:hypothetical protein n=1 Tax=Herbaspirillum sp. CF444 TaxID=1144319 RepID=UPI0002726868|nr:hypothetical protein [Herbaspirillum sp. CF444]EJL94072.1 hypothetical protein PMI16_00427 [Herbaspirillum sp. CF444]